MKPCRSLSLTFPISILKNSSRVARWLFFVKTLSLALSLCQLIILVSVSSRYRRQFPQLIFVFLLLYCFFLLWNQKFQPSVKCVRVESAQWEHALYTAEWKSGIYFKCSSCLSKIYLKFIELKRRHKTTYSTMNNVIYLVLAFELYLSRRSVKEIIISSISY